MNASKNANVKRPIALALFVIALLVAILAGIGTGDSFETSSSLWGESDSTSVQAKR